MTEKKDFIVLDGSHISHKNGIGNILVEAPTGIFYEVQCGGSACDHVFIEGWLLKWETDPDFISDIRKLEAEFDECSLLGCSMVHYDPDEDCYIPYHDAPIIPNDNSEEARLKKLEEDSYFADKIDEFLKKIFDITGTSWQSNSFSLRVNRDPVVMHQMREGLIPVLVTFNEDDVCRKFLPHSIAQGRNFMATRTVTGHLHLGNCD